MKIRILALLAVLGPFVGKAFVESYTDHEIDYTENPDAEVVFE